MTGEDRQALEERCKKAMRLLEESVHAGYRLSVESGRLEIKGSEDADPQLRERLLDLMAPIMPLFLMRDRLLALGHQMGVPRDLVMRIPPEWLRDLVGDYAEWEAREDEDGHPNGQRFLALYLLKVVELEEGREP
jgi:hypothetical protein